MLTNSNSLLTCTKQVTLYLYFSLLTIGLAKINAVELRVCIVHLANTKVTSRSENRMSLKIEKAFDIGWVIFNRIIWKENSVCCLQRAFSPSHTFLVIIQAIRSLYWGRLRMQLANSSVSEFDGAQTPAGKLNAKVLSDWIALLV